MPRRINPETGRGYALRNKSGRRVGRLVYIELQGVDHHNHLLWSAKCDCGKELIRPYSNKIVSCGCYRREQLAERQRARARETSPEVREERKVASRKKVRERRKNDPVRNMQARLSRLHRWAIQRIGGIKSSPTFEALGYSPIEFADHIERQFLPGMSWENMREWQIDHIIPMSSAKTIEDVVRLNQLPNLRPLWAKENNAKKDRRTSLL